MSSTRNVTPRVAPVGAEPPGSDAVLAEIVRLQKLDLGQLQVEWRRLFGAAPPAYRRRFLLERLCHRVQEQRFGGLGDDVQERLAEISREDALVAAAPTTRTVSRGDRTTKRQARARGVPPAPLPHTQLRRLWRGREYTVTIRERGFEFEGRVYRSLSAIANEITGSHRNGRVFFEVGAKFETERPSRRVEKR